MKTVIGSQPGQVAACSGSKESTTRQVRLGEASDRWVVAAAVLGSGMGAVDGRAADIADHPDLAERYGLLSFEYDLLDTHALVINGDLAGVGHPAEGTMRSWLDRAASEALR